MCGRHIRAAWHACLGYRVKVTMSSEISAATEHCILLQTQTLSAPGQPGWWRHSGLLAAGRETPHNLRRHCCPCTSGTSAVPHLSCIILLHRYNLPSCMHFLVIAIMEDNSSVFLSYTKYSRNESNYTHNLRQITMLLRQLTLIRLL